MSCRKEVFVRKSLGPHMFVLSKLSNGEYLVTLGDPKNVESKLIRGPMSKDDLRDWVRRDVARRVGTDHIIDTTGLKLVPIETSHLLSA